MGGSELGFALGFNNARYRIIDDRFLGYYSGIAPDLYVSNAYYVANTLAGQPAWAASRRDLEEHYRLVYENSAYKIYKRNAAASK